MKRRRFFEALTAALLAVLIAAVPAAPAMAQGNSGKNKDDSGGDEATTPPPFTYLIRFEEDFEVRNFNDNADMLGYIPIDGVEKYVGGNFAVIYDGQFYVLDEFFVGTDSVPRQAFDLSERDENGSVYICGSCDTLEGIRGFRMQVTPTDYGLVQTAFSVLPPADGDTRSVFQSVNSNGEAVGYSDAGISAESAILFQSDELGTITIADTWVDRVSMRVSEFGEVLAIVADEASSWTPAAGLLPLPNAQDVVFIGSSNDLGEFLGEIEVVTTSKKGTVSTERVQIFYDGSVTVVEEQYRFSEVNNNLDRFGSYWASGKGNKPGRMVGELYLVDEDTVFEVDNMIDESNSATDVERWFSIDDGIHYRGGLGSTGLLAGYFLYTDTNGLSRRATVVLTPVLP